MTSSSVFSPASDVDVFAADHLQHPYQDYGILRDAGPVVRLSAYPVWFMGRYEDVRSAAMDWESFSSADGVGMTDEMNANTRGTVLASDPPEHDVLRSVLTERLAPRALARLRNEISERADALVADVVARGSFDAATDLCQRLPVDVVADLIGLPPEGRERLLPGASAAFASFGPLDARLQARMPAVMSYLEYMQSFTDRSSFAPDSWGAAIYDAVDAGHIAAESAIPLVTAYLVASMDTTVNGLTAYMRFMAEDPDLWAALKADRGLVAAGFEETLRMESPARGFFRKTTREVDVDGVTLPAQSRVFLCFAAANRDERHYPDPDRFDIRRNPIDHLAFGYGVHGCAGQGLARIEARALIESLLRRVDRIELAGDPVIEDHPITRGIEHLPVSVVPSKEA